MTENDFNHRNKLIFFSLFFFVVFLNNNGFRNNNNYGVYIGADYGHYELTNVVASTDTRRTLYIQSL